MAILEVKKKGTVKGNYLMVRMCFVMPKKENQNSLNRFFIKIIIISLIMIVIPLSVFAHSGGTDSSGGHRDNKNASGLGSYHYHHGYGPHLHPNGVCPYASKEKTTDASTALDSIKTIGVIGVAVAYAIRKKK